jgi:hypothetical protein
MKNNFFILIALVVCVSCTKEETKDAITNAEYDELLALSDTSTLNSEADVEHRLSRITGIFQRHRDNRGLFPLVYEQTTHQALLSLRNEPGNYQDLQKAKDITVAFCKRYLFNLHDHLLGIEPEYHWKNYYTLCFSHQPMTRSMAAGLNAHLTVDLARAVYDVSGDSSFKNDYTEFGEALVKASPYIIAELQEQYQVDAAYLFHGLFIGDLLDAVFGKDFTTALAFQLIRQEAYDNAQKLLNPATHATMQESLYNNWALRERLLNELVTSKLIK